MVQTIERFEGPRRLAVLILGERQYFTDLRLGQFRDTRNPGGGVAFDSPQGRQLCRLGNVVSCRYCGTHVIVSSWLRRDPMRCIHCGSVVE